MSKCNVAIAGALYILLLASCGGQGQPHAENIAVASDGKPLENSSSPDPTAPGPSANGIADPVPPPDAVSHPDGYLPPAPAEPDPASANSSGPDSSPPATEDEYTRNRQSAR